MSLRSLLGGGLLVLCGLPCATAPAAEKAGPPATVKVQKGLLRIVVHTTGTVIPFAEAAIQARAAGDITSVTAQVGQIVKRGQPVLVLDPAPFQRAVERAQADLAEAEAHWKLAQLRAGPETDLRRASAEARAALGVADDILAQATAEVKRLTERLAAKQATEAELRQSEKRRDEALSRRNGARTRADQLASSTATLELRHQELLIQAAAATRARLDLEAARANLSKSILVAPIDGMITECPYRPGQAIAPGIVDSGAPVCLVSDLSRVAVQTEITEDQLRDIQPNVAATVVLPVFPERRFAGRLASISVRGRARAGKTVFPVRVECEGDAAEAGRIGLFANVEFVAIEKSDALLLDNKAMRWAPTGPFVVVLEQGKPRQQAVKLGRTDGVRSEILEGLRDGDDVILPPPPPPPAPAK